MPILSIYISTENSWLEIPQASLKPAVVTVYLSSLSSFNSASLDVKMGSHYLYC